MSILAAVVVAVIAISYFVAGNIQSKISEIELKHEKALAKLQTETSIRIERLEKDVEDLKEDCKQAERDYAAARQAVSRIRRKK